MVETTITEHDGHIVNDQSDNLMDDGQAEKMMA